MNDSIGLYLNEIGKVPLLTAAEERELSRAIEAGRDAAQRKARGEKGREIQRAITAAELAGTGLVTREAASGTRRFFEQALRDQAQLTPVPPLAELSSTTAIKSAVAAGVAPAVLSSLAVAGELAAGTLLAVPVNGLDLRRALRAVWPAGRRLTGPAQDLYQIAARTARPA